MSTYIDRYIVPAQILCALSNIAVHFGYEIEMSLSSTATEDITKILGYSVNDSIHTEITITKGLFSYVLRVGDRHCYFERLVSSKVDGGLTVTSDVLVCHSMLIDPVTGGINLDLILCLILYNKEDRENLFNSSIGLNSLPIEDSFFPKFVEHVNLLNESISKISDSYSNSSDNMETILYKCAYIALRLSVDTSTP